MFLIRGFLGGKRGGGKREERERRGREGGREGGRKERGRKERREERREEEREGESYLSFVSVLLYSKSTHFDLFLELSDPEYGIPLFRRYLLQLTTIFLPVA